MGYSSLASQKRLGLLDVSPGALSIFESLRNVSHEGFRGALMVFTYTYISETPYTERIHLPTRHTLLPFPYPRSRCAEQDLMFFQKDFLSFIIHTCYIHATEQPGINMYSHKSLWQKNLRVLKLHQRWKKVLSSVKRRNKRVLERKEKANRKSCKFFGTWTNFRIGL